MSMSEETAAAEGDSSRPVAAREITVCMPVYNDWTSAQMLLEEIDELAERSGEAVSVVLIDDGSTDPCPVMRRAPRWLRRIQVVHLRRNVGHQRAIALGLCFIHETTERGLTVVMDADG